MPRLIRRAVLAAFITPVLGLYSCSEPAQPAPTSANLLIERSAWVASMDGLTLVAETVAAPPQGEAVLTEHEVLLERFQLPPTSSLMRLHLLSDDGQQMLEPGTLELPDGTRFSPLGVAPASLSRANRLLWETLALGGAGLGDEPAIQSHRRSFLLVSPDFQRHKPESVKWSRSDLSLTLKYRTWTDRQRQVFIEGALAQQHD